MQDRANVSSLHRRLLLLRDKSIPVILLLSLRIWRSSVSLHFRILPTPRESNEDMARLLPACRGGVDVPQLGGEAVQEYAGYGRFWIKTSKKPDGVSGDEIDYQ